MTVVDLADKAEISHPYLVRIEGGKRKLSLPIAQRLAIALGVPVAELLGLDTNQANAASSVTVPDAEPFNDSAREFAPVIAKRSRDIKRWRILTNALDRAKVRAGAIVYVSDPEDADDALRPLDCVLAQVVTPNDAAGPVVVRQFLPPCLLVTNSSESNAIPLDMDKGEAVIIGVITGEYSPLRS